MVYTVYEVVKKETKIKGYWKDESGKVYIDNIKLYTANNWIYFNQKVLQLFKAGELAVFWVKEGKAIVESKEGKITVLNHCIQWKERELTEGYIKELLNQHSGFTVYQKKGYFLIETWKE